MSLNMRLGAGVAVLLGVAFSLMLWTAATAQAQTAEECQTKISALRDQTAQATTFANPKDQDGLIGKLDSASSKLSQGNTADALANLSSFRNKVSVVAAQGKLSLAEADALIAGADDTISCVQSLSTV